MWNPFSYISSSSSPQLPSPSSQSNLQSHTLSMQSIQQTRQKYLIEEHANFHKRIKDFQMLVVSKSYGQEQNSRMIRIFSQMIENLQQFMSHLNQLKQQYEQNLAKIQNYDNCIKKLQKHDNVVESILEQQQKQRDAIVQMFRQKQSSFQVSLDLYQKQIDAKTQEIELLNGDLIKIRELNEKLAEENGVINGKLAKFEQKYSALRKRLSLVMGQEISSQEINNQIQNPLHSINQNNLPKVEEQSPLLSTNLSKIIFSLPKFTNKITPYLHISDIFSLSLANKHTHSIIFQSKTLSHLIYQRLSSQNQKQLLKLKQQSIYFNHLLLDELDGDNVKISAIKYLFFSHKPGTYILNMFQEDITMIEDDVTFGFVAEEEGKDAEIVGDPPVQMGNGEQSSPDNSRVKKSWRDYFKSQKSKDKQKESKSIQNQVATSSISTSSTQHKFSLAQLKNSNTFQKIQHQMSKSFHQHVFSLKLPKDLESFGKIMTQQFAQLKKELNFCGVSQKPTIKQWTSKLLTLAKFLYLQSQQLWTLGQNMFSKLMQYEKENTQLKSQLQDLTQNHIGLRRLVDQLAKNKLQMQKRIWQSERKNGFLKLSTENIQKVNERLEKQIQSLRTAQQSENNKIYQLQKELSSYKQKIVTLRNKYRQKMEEFNQLKEEISKISWI